MVSLIGPVIPDRITVTTRATDANRLADLRFGLRTIDQVLIRLRNSKKSFEISLKGAQTAGNVSAVIRLTDIISGLNTQINTNTKTRAGLINQIDALNKTVVKSQGGAVVVAAAASSVTPTSTNTTSSSSASSVTGGTNTTTPSGDSAQAPTVEPASAEPSSPVEYNLPAAKDGYFQNMKLMYDGRVGLVNPGKTKVDDANLYINNTPARVTDALDLWVKTQASKGMVQTYIPRNNFYKDIFSGVDAESVSDFQAAADISSLKKYGFQFQYNPASVSMPISGTAAVDYMKYVVEPPKVIPDTGSGSSISFSIMLNRMFDMPYLNADGTLKQNLSVGKVYGVQATGFDDDLKDIYNKGTMYDVEYLMKTIIGFELNTIFRGKTADVGFLLGRLIELHLGKSLRYLVTINSINIEHVHFDARMVPLMSFLTISCSRIPDFAPRISEG